MSVKSAARASRNPFVGTHTRRLVQETSKAVDVFFARSSIKHEKRGKNLFDYAFRFHNLGVRLPSALSLHPHDHSLCQVGRRFQHEAWRAIEKDPSNPQNYWTVTRIVEATRVRFFFSFCSYSSREFTTMLLASISSPWRSVGSFDMEREAMA